MHQIMFTIYDSKAEAYLPPFFLPTEGMAARTFQECCNSADHQFGKHPHDYTLFKLGTFDDKTANIETERQTLGNGLEYVQQKPIGLSEHETTIGDDTPIQPSSGSGNSA